LPSVSSGSCYSALSAEIYPYTASTGVKFLSMGHIMMAKPSLFFAEDGISSTALGA
jgi:hypothetical protein